MGGRRSDIRSPSRAPCSGRGIIAVSHSSPSPKQGVGGRFPKHPWLFAAVFIGPPLSKSVAIPRFFGIPRSCRSAAVRKRGWVMGSADTGEASEDHHAETGRDGSGKRHAVCALGNNLYLDVRSETSRAWLFIWKQNGRNRYAGLGSASGSKGHKVTLVEARRKADSFRASIASGFDPRVEEKRQTTLLGPYADSYVTSIESGFRSAKSAYSWRLSFTVHAAALRDIPVASITSADILAVLTPMWFTRGDAARRLRHRLERVLRTAKAAGLRSGDNPALMENLGLPKHKKRGAGAPPPGHALRSHPRLHGNAAGSRCAWVTAAATPDLDRHSHRRSRRRAVGRNRPRGTGLDDPGRPGEERRKSTSCR